MARLKKEQMQLLILGAVVVVGGLFAAVNFLLVPMINQWKTDNADAMEIRAKVEDARRVVRARADVLGQLAAERARIEGFQEFIPRPVLGNYLLEMDAAIRRIAETNALDIISVTDNDITPINYAEGLCKIYQVRVNAEGGYNNLTAFLGELERDNPLFVVSAVNMVPQEGKPEKHDIRLVMGWLIWAQPDQLPGYVTNTESVAAGDVGQDKTD